jgi:hypothetical protein
MYGANERFALCFYIALVPFAIGAGWTFLQAHKVVAPFFVQKFAKFYPENWHVSQNSDRADIFVWGSYPWMRALTHGKSKLTHAETGHPYFGTLAGVRGARFDANTATPLKVNVYTSIIL